MMITPPKEREIDRARVIAQGRQPQFRTPRERWLVEHWGRRHRLEGLDNHDQCSCGAVFWRPNGA